uniref:Uncharacterized protein n=1 Tax=Setaria viridis TaxID=4556 RepID=A0A4U6VW43_SETVI|nr:hypothetical protein SEVIR_2G253500v2 [Setaria viridis]
MCTNHLRVQVAPEGKLDVRDRRGAACTARGVNACARTGGWPFSRPMASSSSTCSPQRPRHALDRHRRTGSHGRLGRTLNP